LLGITPPRVGIVADEIAGTGGVRRADSALASILREAGVRLRRAYAIMAAAN